MTVYLPEHDFTYYGVPKVCSTSLKTLFFRLQNGYEFRNLTINDRTVGIHQHYWNKKFGRYRYKTRTRHVVALVRDPVERLLSCYANRVVKKGMLSENRLTRRHKWLGARPDPDLDAFIDRLEVYSAVPGDIRHHTRSLVYYLGADAGHYSRLYDVSELDSFLELVRAQTGKTIEMPRENVSASRTSRSELTARQIRRIERFYRRDYEIYGRAMRPGSLSSPGAERSLARI